MSFRYPSLALLLCCTALLAADNYATPRQLLDEKISLEAGPCDLDCYITVAGMYSGSYLKGLRDSAMPALRDENYGEENAVLLFGGPVPLAALEAMSAQEFFARQLMFRGSRVPADYRFSRLEVIGENAISETEVKLQLRFSGVAARPEVEQEGAVTLVKEGGGWKIKP